MMVQTKLLKYCFGSNLGNLIEKGIMVNLKKIYLLSILLMSFQAMAQTEEICPGSTIPIGWAIVDFSPNKCGSCQKKFIIRNTATVTTKSLDICLNSPLPEGWIKTDLSPNICGDRRIRSVANNCNNSESKGTFVNAAKVTKQSIEVCPDSSIPLGWVKSGLASSKCGSFQQKIILTNTAKVTQKSLEVCPDSPIPSGWVKTGLSPNKCGNFQQKIIIKKVS
jgi:hypothetical protein